MEKDASDISEEIKAEILERREKFHAGKLEPSIVVPVNRVVPARQRVLTDQQVREILDRAEAIGLTTCDCRSRIRRCERPLEVCLIVDMTAEEIAGKGDVRRVTREEALEVLDRTTELGLVHLTLWSEGHHPFAICSCCSCCCHELIGLSRFGFSDQVVRSDFVADRDEGKCTGCMTCVTRCNFGALTDHEGEVRFSRDMCFGCGLCASACPSGVISLEERSPRADGAS